MDDLLYVLTIIGWGLLRPGNALTLLAALGLVLLWRGWRRSGWTLAVCGVGGLLAIMLLPVDQVPLRLLERRFPALRALPARVDGIVVLGGAIDPLITERFGMPALNENAERVTTFVALARYYPSARLVFSGGGETEGARLLFAQLGLEGREIAYEGTSRNTRESAVESLALVRPQRSETWLLVTSAAHMPRAVGAFRTAGWQVMPVPVGYKAGSLDAFYPGFDLGSQLRTVEMAQHEWMGLVAYRLAGWTDTLFPGPEP